MWKRKNFMIICNMICVLIVVSIVVFLVNSVVVSVNVEVLFGFGNVLDKFCEFIIGLLVVVLGIIGVIVFGFMIMFGLEFFGFVCCILMFIFGFVFIMGVVGIIDCFRGSDVGMIYVLVVEVVVFLIE